MPKTREERLQDGINSLHNIGLANRRLQAIVLEELFEVLRSRSNGKRFYQPGLIGLRLVHSPRTPISVVTGHTRHLPTLRIVAHECQRAGYEVTLYEDKPELVVMHQVV